MTEVPTVVFDLDDTLYLERDYVRSGFRAVADEIARSLPRLGRKSFEILWDEFGRNVRGNSFDRLASALPDVAASMSVDRMIGIYRGHVPEIAPIPGARRLLHALKSRGLRCGLITDGRECQQLAKLDALGLGSFFDRVIINEARDRFKPDSRSFRQMQRDLGADGARCWYLADNPLKDFIGPHLLGWRSIRLRRPGQLCGSMESTDPQPDVTIGDLNAVMKTLERADNRNACP
jgi:putative hydrolase of the HAD superfamily